MLRSLTIRALESPYSREAVMRFIFDLSGCAHEEGPTRKVPGEACSAPRHVPTQGNPFQVGVISGGSAKELRRLTANPIAAEILA